MIQSILNGNTYHCDSSLTSVGQSNLLLYLIDINIRPCHIENTGSRPITEIKQCQTWLVLGWVTVL
jgi:hypothetical protein